MDSARSPRLYPLAPPDEEGSTSVFNSFPSDFNYSNNNTNTNKNNTSNNNQHSGDDPLLTETDDSNRQNHHLSSLPPPRAVSVRSQSFAARRKNPSSYPPPPPPSSSSVPSSSSYLSNSTDLPSINDTTTETTATARSSGGDDSGEFDFSTSLSNKEKEKKSSSSSNPVPNDSILSDRQPLKRPRLASDSDCAFDSLHLRSTSLNNNATAASSSSQFAFSSFSLAGTADSLRILSYPGEERNVVVPNFSLKSLSSSTSHSSASASAAALPLDYNYNPSSISPDLLMSNTASATPVAPSSSSSTPSSAAVVSKEDYEDLCAEYDCLYSQAFKLEKRNRSLQEQADQLESTLLRERKEASHWKTTMSKELQKSRTTIAHLKNQIDQLSAANSLHQEDLGAILSADGLAMTTQEKIRRLLGEVTTSSLNPFPSETQEETSSSLQHQNHQQTARESLSRLTTILPSL